MAGLVRMGGGLGPALGISKNSTHGVVASSTVYSHIPQHLLAPLHQAHCDLAQPLARPFLCPPDQEWTEEQATASLSVPREVLYATRQMGMVASRFESGYGTVHTVFSKTPAHHLAAAQAETLLHGALAGTY